MDCKCSCIRGVYKFNIEAINTDTLIYTDLSDWMDEDPYIIPEYHTITITLPVSKGEVEVEVKPLSSTKITAAMLGYAGCLPDGVYCFSTWGCINCDNTGEKKYKISELLTPRLSCELDNILSTENYENVAELNSRLEMIESIASLGLIDEAKQNFKQLKKDVQRYNCELCVC